MKKFNILVVLLTSIGVLCYGENISVNVTFDKQNYTISNDTINGKIYSKIGYKDLIYNFDSIGAPMLPYKLLQISVPHNASNFTVTSQSLNVSEIILSAQLYPIQVPVTSNISVSDVEFTYPDSAIYSSPNDWPLEKSVYINHGYLYGANHIVSIAVYPMTYNALLGKLHFSETIQVTLNYSIVSEPALDIKPIVCYDKTDEVARYVVNPNQVAEFSANYATSYKLSDANGQVAEPLQYCVVTNRELAPAFNRLLSWKRQKGYKAEIFCIEDIISDSRFANGDTISGINDDAGKLRSFLRNLYTTRNLEYVLLAGDYTILPIRYGSITRYGSIPPYGIPTDLYFSEFNSNWNPNNNGYYGENSEYIDIYPEITIGRLLCETYEEVENYTDKLLCYETFPGDGDFSYLKRAMYSHSDNLQYYNGQAYELADILSPIYQDYKIFEQEALISSTPKGADVINDMKTTKYGFFCINGHGSPEGVCVNSKKNVYAYGVSALDAQIKYLHDEQGNGLDNLCNYKYPNVSYSLSCILMPFDIAVTTDGFVFDDIYCNFGRAFTSYGKYGGVAFLGNTRDGWVQASFEVQKMFLKEILNGNYCLGKAEHISRSKISDRWINYAHNLLGDPEFEIWTDIPTTYEDAIITCSGNSITIRGNDIHGSYIGILGIDGSTRRIKLESMVDTTMQTIQGIAPNSSFVIYKHNKIPKFMPMYIQNTEIYGEQYLKTEDLFIGRNIDDERASGDVIFVSGAHYNFDVDGNVVIDNGVIIDSEVNVKINSKNEVNVKGLKIKSGGTLQITAKRVNLWENINVEHGGKLIINNKMVEL